MSIPKKPAPSTSTRPGVLTRKVAISKGREVEHEKVTHSELYAPVPGVSGISGVQMGMTFPGPKNSFKSARAEISVYLPHGPTIEDAREAIRQAKILVDEELALAAKDLEPFLKE